MTIFSACKWAGAVIQEIASKVCFILILLKNSFCLHDSEALMQIGLLKSLFSISGI